MKFLLVMRSLLGRRKKGRCGLFLLAVVAVVSTLLLVIVYHYTMFFTTQQQLQQQEKVATADLRAGSSSPVVAATEVIAASETLQITDDSQQAEKEQKQQQPVQASVSRILPAPLDYLRRNISLESVYDFYPHRQFSGSCSCLNSTAPTENCCTRIFRRCHKMGVVMTRSSFNRYKPKIINFSRDPFALDYLKETPENDYRDVLMLRSIYSSFVSGYQYHKLGRECWTDTLGRPADGRMRWRSVYEWWKVINYEPEPPRNGRSLCKYLAEESEEAGMRAYMDYIMHSQYIVMLSHFALALGLPEIRERTLTICYEDVTHPDRANDSLNKAIQFWYNGTSNKQWKTGPPGEIKQAEDHSTSHDPEVKERLIQVIKDVDQKYYNGDIAWLDSVLPC